MKPASLIAAIFMLANAVPSTSSAEQLPNSEEVLKHSLTIRQLRELDLEFSRSEGHDPDYGTTTQIHWIVGGQPAGFAYGKPVPTQSDEAVASHLVRCSVFIYQTKIPLNQRGRGIRLTDSESHTTGSNFGGNESYLHDLALFGDVPGGSLSPSYQVSCELSDDHPNHTWRMGEIRTALGRSNFEIDESTSPVKKRK